MLPPLLVHGPEFLLGSKHFFPLRHHLVQSGKVMSSFPGRQTEPGKLSNLWMTAQHCDGLSVCLSV